VASRIGMDGRAFTRFFKTSPQFLNWRVFAALAALIALWPTAMAHLFFWRIENGLNLKVHQKPLFFLVPGHIHLRNSYIDWEGKFRVSSGSIEVDYPASMIVLNEFPISIKGKGLAIEFGPELRQAIGQDQVVFDRVSTRIVLRPKRKVDIDFLDAESKTIQFHLSAQPK